MLTKQKLLQFIQAMPEDNFENIDVLPERIVLLEKVEKGEKDIEDGKVFSTAEARLKLGKFI